MVELVAIVWSRSEEIRRIDRERRSAERVQRDQRVRANATPETLRKLHRVAIDNLLERGSIGEDQHRAGEEILQIWVALTASLCAKTSSLLRFSGGSREVWPPTLTRAYRERYQPWRTEASGLFVAHRRTVADLVILLAVDNFGLAQIGRLVGIDQRRVLDCVRNSLYRYAELAGWIVRPGEPLDLASRIRAGEFRANSLLT